MTEEEYKKNLDVITKLEDNEKNKGKFVYDKKAIDSRGPEKLDHQLNAGFEILCGIKGSKLSGGQK